MTFRIGSFILLLLITNTIYGEGCTPPRKSVCTEIMSSGNTYKNKKQTLMAPGAGEPHIFIEIKFNNKKQRVYLYGACLWEMFSDKNNNKNLYPVVEQPIKMMLCSGDRLVYTLDTIDGKKLIVRPDEDAIITCEVSTQLKCEKEVKEKTLWDRF